MNESERLRVWNTIRDFLIQSSRRLAYGQEPWVIYSSGRDDADSIEQRVKAEEKFSPEIDELIRQFIANKQWPKGSKSVVRFYAGQRIAWACEFLRVLLTPSATGDLVFQSPAVSGFEFIEWLLITAYNNRFPAPAKQPACEIEGEEKFTAVWT